MEIEKEVAFFGRLHPRYSIRESLPQLRGLENKERNQEEPSKLSKLSLHLSALLART